MESVTTSQSEEMDATSSQSASPSKLPLTIGATGDDNCGKFTIISSLAEAISEKSSARKFEIIDFPKRDFYAGDLEKVDIAILVISTDEGLTWWARKTVRRAEYFKVKKFIVFINDELAEEISDFFNERDLDFKIVYDINELLYELNNF